MQINGVMDIFGHGHAIYKKYVPLYNMTTLLQKCRLPYLGCLF